MAKRKIIRNYKPYLVEGYSSTEFVNIVMKEEHITIIVPFPIDLALILSTRSDESFLDMLYFNINSYKGEELVAYLEELTREFWDYSRDDFEEDRGKTRYFNGERVYGRTYDEAEFTTYFEYGIGGSYFDWQGIEGAVGDDDLFTYTPELRQALDNRNHELIPTIIDKIDKVPIRYFYCDRMRVAIDFVRSKYYRYDPYEFGMIHLTKSEMVDYIRDNHARHYVNYHYAGIIIKFLELHKP